MQLALTADPRVLGAEYLYACCFYSNWTQAAFTKLINWNTAARALDLSSLARVGGVSRRSTASGEALFGGQASVYCELKLGLRWL